MKKTTMIMGAMSVALLTAVSCSETETDFNAVDTNDTPTTLGVTATLKTGEKSKAITRSAVSGTAITYAAADFANTNANPGLGVVLTNSDGDALYTNPNSGYGGSHIWFIGTPDGQTWKSIKQKLASYDATTGVPYFLSNTVAGVYAYYPYTPGYTPTAPAPDAPMAVPAPLLNGGAPDIITIDATTSNAGKTWTGGGWAINGNANVRLSALGEKDYMYFDGTGGRFVSNAGTGGNTSTTNPGPSINMRMAHALTMLSFRVYDGSNLSASAVTFTGFTIQNAGVTENFLIDGQNMSLEDGSFVDDTPVPGGITRTVTGYTLMRQLAAGGSQSNVAFIPNADVVNGRIVSKKVSALVYPLPNFTQGDIEVVITLASDADPGVAGNYPALLTVPTNAGGDPGWLPGKNYIYTLSAGRKGLSVVGVSVVDWADVEVTGEIPL